MLTRFIKIQLILFTILTVIALAVPSFRLSGSTAKTPHHAAAAAAVSSR